MDLKAWLRFFNSMKKNSFSNIALDFLYREALKIWKDELCDCKVFVDISHKLPLSKLHQLLKGAFQGAYLNKFNNGCSLGGFFYCHKKLFQLLICLMYRSSGT